MSFENFVKQLQALNSSLETMAAIGAELRLRQERLSGDPLVRRLLQDVVRAVDPGLLDRLNQNQEQAALGIIRTLFARPPIC
jgi:hypothetical protein